MIHIATVHWMDPTWIDIQWGFFNEHLDVPFRMYAYLDGIDPEKYRDKYWHIGTESIGAHSVKLNLLANVIAEQGGADDLLIFVDGDAFPIASLCGFLETALREYPLVAVQRLENDGDPQPHPSFCATTIRFWKEIRGDWGKGPQWRTNSGAMRSDVGGILWARLRELGIAWKPMLRSNKRDLHPLWFGVYDNMVYHHGAAFRTPYCSLDISKARNSRWRRILIDLAESRQVRSIYGGWFRNAVYSFVMKKSILDATRHSQRMLKEIRSNNLFYTALI